MCRSRHHLKLATEAVQMLTQGSEDPLSRCYTFWGGFGKVSAHRERKTRVMSSCQYSCAPEMPVCLAAHTARLLLPGDCLERCFKHPEARSKNPGQKPGFLFLRREWPTQQVLRVILLRADYDSKIVLQTFLWTLSVSTRECV